MPLASTARGSRAYRVADSEVAGLLGRLQTDAEWLSTDAEAEIVLDHPGLALHDHGKALTVRLRLSNGLGEVRLDDRRGGGSTPPVLAAGRIEELLNALGFEPVRRSVNLRYAFTFDGVRIELVHAGSLGWISSFDGNGPHQEREIERVRVWLRIPSEDPSAATERRVTTEDANLHLLAALNRRSGPDRRSGTDRRSPSASIPS